MMHESDVIARTGLNSHVITGYRHHCGAVKTEWGEGAVRKLEGYLKLETGSLSKGLLGIDDSERVRLVVSRIWLNPHILGVRKEDGTELMRCRVPVHRVFKIGMLILAVHRQGDMWDYRGVVRGQ